MRCEKPRSLGRCNSVTRVRDRDAHGFSIQRGLGRQHDLAASRHRLDRVGIQAAEHLLEQGSGKIVNIASLLTFFGGITVPGYAASKGAVGQLTKALSNEWASKGVNVNAIAPGYMRTDNTAALQADPVRSKEILSRIPANRWGEPSDLEGAVVFLASPASDYLSGHVMAVDGGWCGR